MQVTESRRFMGRFAQGRDLVEEANGFCSENGIEAGEIKAIGAVKNARIGFYDQEKHRYEFLDIEKPMEILSLMGNISLKDGVPFAHLHVILGDHDGSAIGGHLAGAEIFALEYVITEFKSDKKFVRGFDEGTSLPLWPMG